MHTTMYPCCGTCRAKSYNDAMVLLLQEAKFAAEQGRIGTAQALKASASLLERRDLEQQVA